MKKPYYILSSGRLKRRENTLAFEQEIKGDSGEDKIERKIVPVEVIDSIFVFGEVDLNVKVLNFLAQNKIPVHFFNYYEHYTGSFLPKEHLISGHILIKQVEFYLNGELRLEIAMEFIKSANHNIIKTLKYYQTRYGGFDEIISDILSICDKVSKSGSIPELMGLEGLIHKRYFDAWNLILSADKDVFKFEGRERRPPSNPINALISFGNSLLYATVLNEIYKTQLNSGVSYLHEPGERRFSLALDLSEIFKPLLVDRLIFSMINHKEIRVEHFDVDLNFAYLNKKGRNVFISEFDEKLKTTVKHPKLKRNVSYRTLIRLECYKLMKHILGEEKYEGFKIWW